MKDDVEALPIGPKMAALSVRQQKFAWAMAYGEWNATEAARAAGYPDYHHGESCYTRVQAHRLMHTPAVLDAIEEATGSVLRALGPLAVGAAKAILKDRSHPAHARILETILDRSGYSAKTEHKVTVEHVDDGRLLELATRMAAELGVDRAKLIGGNVIEGEATEVTDAHSD